MLHASDWEGVELALSSTNAVEHLSLPYDPAVVPPLFRRLPNQLEFRSLDQCGACELWGLCDVIGVSP